MSKSAQKRFETMSMEGFSARKAKEASVDRFTIAANAGAAGYRPESDASSESRIGAILASSHQGEYEEVDIGLCDENPFNARSIYLPEKIDALATSMLINGQLSTGIAIQNGERRTLIAGHYRRKALLKAGLKTIKLITYPEGALSEQRLYELSFIENNERNEQTALDNAYAWRLALDSKLYASQAELSESIGVSKSSVNRTLALLNLPREVLDVIEETPSEFGVSLLYELSLLVGLASIPHLIELATGIKSGEILRSELKEERTRLQEKEQTIEPRKNKTSRSYTLWGDGSEKLGKIKEWDTGKVQVDVMFDNDEDKRLFLEEIQERFKPK